MSDPDTGSSTTHDLAVPVSIEDHALGDPDAPVTLVEYGDYECPNCMESQPTVLGLLDVLGPRLRFVFRHFPLTSVHPHASVAAEAAEAAGAQGRFWDMHRLLYDSRGRLEPEDLERMALRLSLEIYRFHGDLTTHIWAKKVQRHADTGRKSGVRGTPTFFLNGKRFQKPVSELEGAVRSLI